MTLHIDVDTFTQHKSFFKFLLNIDTQASKYPLT